LVLEEERTCPDCGTATEPVADLIEEAVEEAIMQGAEVVHLPQPALSEYGGMGALLRYQPAKNTEAAKGAA
jgi:peptide subunit release factor 1 (eRF1)